MAHKFDVNGLNLRSQTSTSRCITETIISLIYNVYVFSSSPLEIRLQIKGQKYSDDGMCDDIGNILILWSNPIERSKR